MQAAENAGIRGPDSGGGTALHRWRNRDDHVSGASGGRVPDPQVERELDDGAQDLWHSGQSIAVASQYSRGTPRAVVAFLWKRLWEFDEQVYIAGAKPLTTLPSTIPSCGPPLWVSYRRSDRAHAVTSERRSDPRGDLTDTVTAAV